MCNLGRGPLRASGRSCASRGARVLPQRARIAAGRGRSPDLHCRDKFLHSAATGRISRWEAGRPSLHAVRLEPLQLELALCGLVYGHGEE